MLSQGVILNNRYLLNDRVATGGMGEVWSATDNLLKRRVAVKVLLPSLVSDTEFITRFRTEAHLMAALRHRGIVQVYDYGADAVVDGHRVDYLVMEYIEGVSLSKRIKAAGRLGIGETISVVTQAAQALQVAHAANIVHRDVKPSNLLVQPDGTVVLVDFGVARSTNVTSITGTNIVLGTADYMAPEQIAGRPVSAATDIYALGAVAYCCLTGRPPFTGANPLHVVTQHLQDEPPTLPTEIPTPVAMLVARALAKAPEDRYPSAAAFADAARAAQGAVPAPVGTDRTTTHLASNTLAEAQAVLEPPARRGWSRLTKFAVGAWAVAIALIGVVAVIAILPGKDPSSAEPTTKTGVGAPSLGGPGILDPGTDPTTTARASQSAGRPTKPGATRTAVPTTTGSPQPTTTPSKPSASNPYTAAQACGSGYAVIDSAPLTGTDGGTRGKVYLLYNASNGYNCTVAMKATSVGTKSAASAYLEVQGKPRASNSGSYDYYAGPVRAKAAGSCVKWGGSVSGVAYNSPFEHCD